MKEILEAIEQGKPIQWYNAKNDKWDDTTNKRPNFTDSTYRIKPEKKWRPFNDVDEFIKAAGGLGAIWLKRKTTAVTLLVIGIDYNDKDKPIRVGTSWESFNELLDLFTFADGTPCGVEEDA